MDVEELKANGKKSKAGAYLSPGEGKSNRSKSKKKKRMQEVGMMEVEKHVDGENIGEEDGVEGSRTRLKSGRKKKMMKNTVVDAGETGAEEVKKGSKRKKQRLLEDTEGDEEEEDDVSGDMDPASIDATSDSLDNELKANGMKLKASAYLSPGEGKSNRSKSKKKKRMQEVGMMEVEKPVDGDDVGEEEGDVEGSRTRLKSGRKKKMMKNTVVDAGETGAEEVKKGSKRKKQLLLEDAEGEVEEENDVGGDMDPDSVDVTTDSLNNEQKQSLVDDKKERMKSKKKKQRLLEEAAKADRRGVCYLSRIPPHMDPAKLRHALSQYGEIQRIYLVPEGSNPLQFQKKAAKHVKQSFSEGWVEFTDKCVAKRVANMLNGEQMGGKKRSQFYFDTWNIKYLSKFKWDNLTEETAIKRAVREQKLALELSAAKRERDFYLAKVEKSIALTNIHERLERYQEAPEPPRVIRRMPQIKPVDEKAQQQRSKISMDVLAGVFGGSSE